MIKKEIEKILRKITGTLFKKTDFIINIDYPPRKEYGDYSTTLPLDLAKVLKKNPLKIAEDIFSLVKKEKLSIFKKIEVIKPGFINFFIRENYFRKELEKVLEEKENFGKINIGKGKNTNVEFISANPTGSLHIGNGRGAFFGDVLSSLLSFAGYEIDREYYINDSKRSSQIKELGKTLLGSGVSYKTPRLEKLIKDIIDKKDTKKLNESEAGYLLAREVLKDIKTFVEKKLKINFDTWFSEDSLFKKSKIQKILDILDKKRLTYKKDGAIWLKTSEFGDGKDEVLIRKNGEPTYFLSDIAYHQDKINRGYKKIIDIWGADHQGHIKRMEAVMKILGYKGEFEVLISQIVRLKSGEKLSKRKGNIIELGDLVNEVGLDVTRYFYLSKSLSSQMEFDLDLAKEQSKKNPVFYIQYAYVRIENILRNSKQKTSTFAGASADKQNSKVDLNLLTHPSELNLIRELIKLPELIGEISKNYQLHKLTEYAKNLASLFHQFYRDCRVLDLDKETCKSRLSLVSATKTALKILFSILGISAPKRM
ncbi:MAG: arginine--tRNA ligase [Patescibacteria group bacterium]